MSSHIVRRQISFAADRTVGDVTRVGNLQKGDEQGDRFQRMHNLRNHSGNLKSTRITLFTQGSRLISSTGANRILLSSKRNEKSFHAMCP